MANDAGAIYMKKEAMRRLAAWLSDSLVKGRPFFAAYGDGCTYGFQTMLERKIASVIEAIDSGDASRYTPLIWEPEA